MFDTCNGTTPSLTFEMKQDIKSLAEKIRNSVNDGNDKDVIMEEVYRTLESKELRFLKKWKYATLVV